MQTHSVPYLFFGNENEGFPPRWPRKPCDEPQTSFGFVFHFSSAKTHGDTCLPTIPWIWQLHVHGQSCVCWTRPYASSGRFSVTRRSVPFFLIAGETERSVMKSTSCPADLYGIFQVGMLLC